MITPTITAKLVLDKFKVRFKTKGLNLYETGKSSAINLASYHRVKAIILKRKKREDHFGKDYLQKENI